MNKVNPFSRITFFASLFTLPFMMGCADTEREMIFPNKDLPESATVSLDVPKGAAFKLLISTELKLLRSPLSTDTKSLRISQTFYGSSQILTTIYSGF